MKKTLLNNLKFILVGAILVAGLSFAYADGWVNPTTTPPGANVPVPLHTGPTQVKDGGLGVGTFAVNQDAQFAQDTYINGAINGGAPGLTTSQVAIGGTDNNGTAHTTPVTVAGDVSVNGTIANASVANTDSDTLCATSAGIIELCNAPAVAPTQAINLSISLIQPTIAGCNNGGNANGCLDPMQLEGFISSKILSAVTFDVYASDTIDTQSAAPSGGVSMLSNIKNIFTAHAAATSTCQLPATPIDIGSITIPEFTSNSNPNNLVYSYYTNCPNAVLTAKNITPSTDPTSGETIQGFSGEVKLGQ